MTFRTSRLTLIGAAALLLAAPIVAQDQDPAPAEKKVERTFEKKVVIVGDHDGDDSFFYRMIADKYNDVDCQEENGKKVCVARMHGPMSLPGFAGTFLGVELTDSTPELREHLGAPRDGGVLVSRVQEDSPAAEAGIQVGDIITAVEGEAVENARDLRHAIASREAGAAVKIDLYRDGRAEQISATLAQREPRDFMKLIGSKVHAFDSEELQKTIDEALAGIDFEQLDADVRKRLDEIDWDKIKETIREALDESMTHEERQEK